MGYDSFWKGLTVVITICIKTENASLDREDLESYQFAIRVAKFLEVPQNSLALLEAKERNHMYGTSSGGE